MQKKTHNPDKPVVLFGGSFNPVHRGHLAIIRGLAALPDFDEVLVIPARKSPFKPGVDLLPDTLRYEMLSKCLAGMEKVSLLDVELRRPAPSYTMDTLKELQGLRPGKAFFLALGWDAFEGFSRWHQAGAILEACGLLVFGRAQMQQEMPESLGEMTRWLPQPWASLAGPSGADSLSVPDGRVLMRLLALDLPAISARHILSDRRIEAVPEQAQALLRDYWEHQKEG